MNIRTKKTSKNVVILDGPGINGAGGLLSRIRFAAYADAGGPCLHPLEPSAEHIAKVDYATKAADQAVAEYKLNQTNT